MRIITGLCIVVACGVSHAYSLDELKKYQDTECPKCMLLRDAELDRLDDNNYMLENQSDDGYVLILLDGLL